jgi:hypothetical protein
MTGGGAPLIGALTGITFFISLRLRATDICSFITILDLRAMIKVFAREGHSLLSVFFITF